MSRPFCAFAPESGTMKPILMGGRSGVCASVSAVASDDEAMDHAVTVRKADTTSYGRE